MKYKAVSTTIILDFNNSPTDRIVFTSGYHIFKYGLSVF